MSLICRIIRLTGCEVWGRTKEYMLLGAGVTEMGACERRFHLDVPVRYSTGDVPWAVAYVSLGSGTFSKIAQRLRGRIITPRELIQRNKGVQSHSPLALPRRGLDEGAAEAEKEGSLTEKNLVSVIRKSSEELEVNSCVTCCWW